MKRRGILHPELAQVLAALGHGDLLVVADAGLPIPPGVRRIDLAYAPGRPPFLDVLEAVLEEMEVEGAILAEELPLRSPALHQALVQRLQALPKLAAAGVEYRPHEAFKALLPRARAVVRTGEITPYANAILVAGVTF